MEQVAESKENIERGKVNCEFNWHKEPLTWGGMNETEIREVVNELADFFKISPEDSAKINIHFGDHQPFTYLDGHQETVVAKMIPTFDVYPDGQSLVAKTDIVLNRSRELTEQIYRDNDNGESGEKLADYDFIVDDEVIVATLRNSWEGAIWLIAEELNHAAVYLRLKDKKKIEKADINYTTYIQAFFDSDRNDDNYTYDIVEVTASRQVLRFLEKMAATKDDNVRASFFKKMREKSLEKRMVVIPRTALILDDLYLRTGYQPEERK